MPHDDTTLAGQVILVTGVTGGIGSATAHRLAEAGASLALAGRDATRVQRFAEQLNGPHLPLAFDVTDERAVSDAMDRAAAHFGRLDTLINVPGLSVPAKLVEMDVDDFDRTFDVNVKGMFLCSKHFIRQVDAQRGGLIVNISSVAGKAANPNAPAYCAAKAAMNMLANGLALQTREANVRISIISPGAVSTKGFWGDRPVPHEKFLKPGDVAEIIAGVLALPRHIVVHDVVFESWEFFKSK